MAESLAHYSLEPDGAIHHWLACGPVATELCGLERAIRAEGSPFGRGGRWAIANAPDSLELKLRVYRQLPPGSFDPRGPAPRPLPDGPGPKGDRRWEYVVAEEDHLIDMSLFNFTPTLMEGWLFARVQAAEPCTLAAELLTIGPTHLWVNGELQAHHVAFGYVEPAVVPFQLKLAPGLNDLWLYGEMIGWREARLAMGLRLPGRPPVSVALPIGNLPAEGWHRAEEELAGLQLRRFAFPELPCRIWLSPAAPAPVSFHAQVSIPLPHGAPSVFQKELDGTKAVRTHPMAAPSAQARLSVEPGGSVALPVSPELVAAAARLPNEFEMELRLAPVDGSPLVIRRGLWFRPTDYHRSAGGDYESRRRELLAALAELPYEVMGSIAAVQTGRAKRVDPAALAAACQFMEERRDCADFYALSLLFLLDRLQGSPALDPQDRRRVADAFRRFKYWIDEPGIDAMCYFTENHQILFHVTAYLAGQRWRDTVFANSGVTGVELRARAQRRIVQWIRRRLRGGFSEWDSNAYLALDAYAMLGLVELADSPRLREMAGTLLHKIFFVLACQSYRGAHGCSHGRTYVASLKSARAEGTSGLQYLAWGLGGFNGETRATGALALARRYRVPYILQQIGADLPDLLVTRAHSAGRYRPRFDLRRGEWSVDTLTRRTPDYMLSAAVDHRPGATGTQEQLWQATLGPEAVVFTNYPGNSQEHGNARPNFWAGSARLPRVAMADRTVICLYNPALGGGLGFSHAYFPTDAFDEYAISGQWAFARVDGGYVALWGDGDLRLTSSGRHAGQELRSDGSGAAWVCSVGSRAEDGDFGHFCRRVAERSPEVDGANLRGATPDGREWQFGWQGPFVLDGRNEPLSFPHYENLYTQTAVGAERMTIRHGGQELILDLVRGRSIP